jgi:(p)ppGpp synthase/HD superfamily hydrolase
MNEFNYNYVTHCAFLYAKAAHERVGQIRKFGPTPRPYILHPVQVAEYVRGTVHDDVITVAVALNHDVLEDTLKPGQSVYDAAHEMRTYFRQMISDDEVAEQIVTGVLEVTDVAKPSDGNRAARMAINCEHAGKAAPERQTVKLADMKSNMPSICKFNPGFARKWVEEKANVYALMTQGDPALHKEVGHMIEMYRKNLFNPDNYDIV